MSEFYDDNNFAELFTYLPLLGKLKDGLKVNNSKQKQWFYKVCSQAAANSLAVSL